MCYARRQRLSWARIKLSKKYTLAYLVCLSTFFRASLIRSCFTCFLGSFLLISVSYSLGIDDSRSSWLQALARNLALFFSSFFRCSIFKVRSLPTLSRGQLCYYTTFDSICQYLFEKFLIYFFGSVRRLSDSLYSISRFSLLVKGFSKVFFKPLALRGKLVYFITSSPFCQPFFWFFYSFVENRQIPRV